MHELARALMLSAADAPSGAAAGEFVAARVAGLVRLGAFDDALKLADLVPMGGAADELRRGTLEALLWSGDTARACEIARAQVRTTPTLPWRKALVICQAIAGERDAAALSLALLREGAGEDDAPFLAAAGALVGDAASAAPALDDPYGFAASRAAEVTVAEADLASRGPAALRALALSSRQTVEVRLAAAERAAAMGALSPDELASAYTLPAFTDDELAEPDPGPGALGRALLFQAARREQLPERRAARLAGLFVESRDGPGFGPMARATGVSLLSVAPDDQLVWFAADAVPALIAAGRGEAAQAWSIALGERAARDPEARAARIAVGPLLAAAGVGDAWSSARAAEWWRAMPEGADANARMAAVTAVFIILDSLGLPVGPEGWAVFTELPDRVVLEVPNVGIRYAMRDAARADRAGETALWALIAIGDGGPAGAEALTVGSVIRALRAVGLQEAAREIAYEALTEATR